MKKSILIFLFFTILLFAQENTQDLNKNVTGLILSDKGVFLVLGDEYILLEKADPYEEYYMKIYSDPTIVNPNTELKEEFNLSIIPFLSPSISQSNRIDFNEPHELGLFLRLNESNNFNLTSYARTVVDSLFKK